MTESETKPDLPDWTEEDYKGLAGQLFIVGFHGTTPSKDIEMLIREYKVGAIVLFQRNVESADQLRNLVNSLQEIARSAGYKQGLFIAIDQENGLVTRIKPPIAPQLPGGMALGATGDASNAYKIACATSETLKSFGINMNYGPIADVNSEPKNPVIGVRSPSDNPEFVGKFVSEQLRGFREAGIASCVKHFPGHGDTSVDSHYGLPEIPKSMAQIRACELVPFKRAIDESAESVMTAHIKLSGLSEELPASLSPFAISLLRKELGFKGLIVSDCLEMDGVRGPYGTEKAAVMALKVGSYPKMSHSSFISCQYNFGNTDMQQAGTDCVMVCHTISAQVGAINLVVDAVKSGELSWKNIVKSVRRLKHLKEKYVSEDRAPIPPPSLTSLKLWESRQERLAARVYAKSTTLVRNSIGLLPLPPDGKDSHRKYVFLSPGKPAPVGGAVDSGEEKTRVPYTPAAYIDVLRAQRKFVEDLRFQEGVDLSEEENARLEEANIIVLATRNASLIQYQNQKALELGKKWGEKLVVIATCDPYDFLDEADIIKNYIAIYEPTIPAFQSAVNVMFGITEPSGSLPVGKPTAGIRPLGKQVDYFLDSETDLDILHDMWNTILPDWPVEREFIKHLVDAENARHVIHSAGFCISFLINSVHGRVAVLGVLPEHRGKGIGTSLLAKASEELRSEAAPHGGLKSFCLGSVFPRIWPGVPINISQEYKDFFVHRGWFKSVCLKSLKLKPLRLQKSS